LVLFLCQEYQHSNAENITNRRSKFVRVNVPDEITGNNFTGIYLDFCSIPSLGLPFLYKQRMS